MTPSPAAAPEILTDIILDAMARTREQLLENIIDDPTFYLSHHHKEGKKTSKEMLQCDLTAEKTCRGELEREARRRKIDIRVLGEETLWDVTVNAPIVLTKNDPYVIILDMVDGSDLLERDMANWCSAAVAFDPKKGEILVAVVQDYRNNIYVATPRGAFFLKATTTFSKTDEGVKCHIETGLSVPLEGPHHPFPPGKPEANDNNFASICFYGQKGNHFTELPKPFRSWLSRRRGKKREPRFGGRLYTLAGNPMMAKLANGERIHVVFEHVGQFAHDAVPGLFIALKARAIVLRLRNDPDDETKSKGTLVTEDDLAKALYTPCKKHSLVYVLATTRPLADEIFGALTRVPRARRKAAE